MILTKEEFDGYENSTKHEWLLTNGIGGFASSTICSCNTRKYHGLLISSLYLAQTRYMVLSKLNEYVTINDKKYNISTNECPNYLEDGYKYQKYFEKDYTVKQKYIVENIEITKQISMAYGENKIAVSYKIKNNGEKVSFSIMPLVNFRPIHEVRYKPHFERFYDDEILEIKLNDDYSLFIDCDGVYTPFDNVTFDNMYYRIEDERGLEKTEDHYIPGEYKVDIEKNEEKTISFVAFVEKPMNYIKSLLAEEIIKKEEIRLQMMCKIAGAKTEIQKILAIAADNFIIDNNDKKEIIAGYPWFGSWGRDTFIALEGLTLKTNRYSDAKKIIISFIDYIDNGLVPNLICEDGGKSYNTVDASLLYINAIYKYISYTKDYDLLKKVYPSILKIINAYRIGTSFDIHMDKDGLISAGNENTQLTWMDAKVGNTIPTSRYGKAVEINALWYNAVSIAKVFSDILGESFDDKLITLIKKSFKKFYADEGLFDTIEPFSSQIRPNQLFSIALPFPVVTGDKAREILELVKEKLYTDKGLKTLDANDKEYAKRYEGDVYKRDISYHQGTVWPWLIDLYNTAYKEIYKSNIKMQNVEELLSDRCIGNIAEIYDADEPRYAKGAYAQAWSIAALIKDEF